MRVVVFSVALLLCSTLVVQAFQENNLEDDDFAEFEQFEADDEPINDFIEDGNEVPVQKAKDNDFEAHSETEDEIIVEDEDNEFEHFQDPEEFEGLPDSTPHTSEQPKITISKVPITVRPRWDAYWLEGVLCCLLMAYALGYALGRSKNTSIALNFLKMHKPLLDDNFTLVGETGLDVVAAPDERGWRREAEHVFTMWCSGRVCCEGMLLTLKLIKRQDLVHVLLGIVKPTPDTLQIRVELGKDDGDPFVLCVAQKKHATRLAKEMQDLSVFCPERRPGESHGLPVSMSVMSESAEAAAGVLDTRTCAALHQYATHVQYIHISDRYTGPKQMENMHFWLPVSMSVMSESAEAAAGVLDTRTCAALHQYAAHVQYIHISDRYTGPKQMEETAQTKPPDTERVLLMNIALGADGGGAEVRPLLLLAFHLLERIKRLRLSKEALAKCEKRRQKVAEAWVRGAHAARQEQAAQRREEKRKQEKEKILAEDDPEKQRRWELKEQKREKKRKTPKMKQLKVKAM